MCRIYLSAGLREESTLTEFGRVFPSKVGIFNVSFPIHYFKRCMGVVFFFSACVCTLPKALFFSNTAMFAYCRSDTQTEQLESSNKRLSISAIMIKLGAWHSKASKHTQSNSAPMGMGLGLCSINRRNCGKICKMKEHPMEL